MKLDYEMQTKYVANDEFRKYVFTHLAKAKITLTQLAEMNGVSVGALSHYVNRSKPFTASSFNKFFRIIGIYIDDKTKRVKEISKEERIKEIREDE